MNMRISSMGASREAWMADLSVSLVVFLSALPLNMGLAVISGVPLEKAAAIGFTTAIVGGFVVGFFTRRPRQASGLRAGLAALPKFLYTLFHLVIRMEKNAKSGDTILRLEGAATFIHLPRLAAVLENIPLNARLRVHFEGLAYIDHACLDLLANQAKKHKANGGELILEWEDLTSLFQQRNSQNPRKLRIVESGAAPEYCETLQMEKRAYRRTFAVIQAGQGLNTHLADHQQDRGWTPKQRLAKLNQDKGSP